MAAVVPPHMVVDHVEIGNADLESNQVNFIIHFKTREPDVSDD